MKNLDYEKKLLLKKLNIAKLNNMNKIKGGGSGTSDGTEEDVSVSCTDPTNPVQ